MSLVRTALPTYAVFTELPLCAIKPAGWLRRYLQTQRDGLTGHLEVAGFPFNTAGWSSEQIEGETSEVWWPYEQTGYWIDALVRCGHLLADEMLLSKARAPLNHVLEHAAADGYLGPAFMRTPDKKYRWAHAVFFRALMAEYAATGDPRIPMALARHYLSASSPHTYEREVCNVEMILWTYSQTGDPALLEHARQAYAGFNASSPDAPAGLRQMSSDAPAYEHGVTYNEIAKQAAILYMHTGEQALLDACRHAYRKLDRDHMLVDGVISSSEFLAGHDALASHETCDVADYTWSVGYLLMATGEVDYADKIERACFNAAPGVVTSDFRALQYFSCPNQVIADRHSNHNLYYRGTEWMSFRPNPGTECCPAQVNRIMPNFALRTWMRDGHGGLVAACYSPSQVTAPVGACGQTVTIIEETDYPFREEITFTVQTATPVLFPLRLRIPGWCANPQLLLNGEPLEMPLPTGTYVTLFRTFAPGDRITLRLPMRARVSHWPDGGVAIERGPLVFALGITPDCRVETDNAKSTPDFPAWSMYPSSRWNYALEIDEARLDEQVTVTLRAMTETPWSLEAAPIALQVPARRVVGWGVKKRKRIQTTKWVGGVEGTRTEYGEYQLTPPLPDPRGLPGRLGKRLEHITLVPYGCTTLRLTIFPWSIPDTPG